MNTPSGFLRAPPTSVQMNDTKFIKSLFLWILKAWFMGLVLFATVTSSEYKAEDPSSGLFCISDCATCPVICSPPPPSNANNTTTSSNFTFSSTFSTTILFVTASSEVTITTTTFQVLQHATFRLGTATTYGNLCAAWLCLSLLLFLRFRCFFSLNSCTLFWSCYSSSLGILLLVKCVIWEKNRTSRVECLCFHPCDYFVAKKLRYNGLHHCLWNM